MDGEPTPRWYSVRILLAVAIVAALLVWFFGFTVEASRPDSTTVWSLVAPVASLGLPVVGLIWMIRIFRGPRDEPPSWRYRDR